jgi:WD40 repeat protein
MVLVAALAQPLLAHPKPEREIAIEMPKNDYFGVSWVEFSPVGHLLAVRHAKTGKSDVIRVWNRTDSKSKFEWELDRADWDTFRNGPTCVFAPDGRSVAAAWMGGAGTFRLTEPKPNPPRPLNLEVRSEVGKSETGSGFVWAGEGDKLWRAGTNQDNPRVWLAVNRLTRPGTTWDVLLDAQVGRNQRPEIVALSPDGRLLVVGWEDEGIYKHGFDVWDVARKTKAFTLEGHEGRPSVARFSPNGKVLATGSRDGSVKLWNPENGKELAVIKGADLTVSGLAFDTDGRRLAFSTLDRLGSENLRLVDVESGKYLAGIPADLSGVSNVCFDAGGERVAVYCNVPRVIRVFTVDAILKAGK